MNKVLNLRTRSNYEPGGLVVERQTLIQKVLGLSPNGTELCPWEVWALCCLGH